LKVTDGPNGGRGSLGSMGPTSVCTPVGVALGATWNTELVEQVGSVLAAEVKSKGAHVLLAPTVNIHRSPIAGRNFECYSEDPFINGVMASAYINGIQNNGVGTCIKHYVCNDQEFERKSISSEIEERPLREIYLEPFRIAIKNSKPWSAMSSYNKVRGVYASENEYTLKSILKEEWGFDGAVISDWYGTYTDGVPSGGLDLEMPGPGRWMAPEKVKKALKNGTLSLEELNAKVRRLLLLIQRVGLFDNNEIIPEQSADLPEHREIIREAARQAIVLLKNKTNLLPLKNIRSIAVIGENARWPVILGGGSSAVSPHYVISPLEGIKNRAGSDIKVNYAPGTFIHRTMPAPDPENLHTETGEKGLLVEIFDNLNFEGKPAFSQINSRVQFGWFSDSVPNVDQTKFSVRLSGFFTPDANGKHTFGLGTVGRGKLFIDGNEVIDNWTEPAPYGQKTVILELNSGQYYPISVEYCWEGDPMWRSLSLSHMPPCSDDPFTEAVELAKNSDVVIILAGLTGEWESEGFDRIDMKLPGNQDELITAITAANSNTVVVLNTGSPVEMPWIDKVNSVLQLWYDSQEAGNALADILFGDVSPSGKLPTTFPKKLQDNPSFINFPGENGKVYYGEGLFVGYRYYDKKLLEPLFPFGHGLSYTSFNYKNLNVPAAFDIETGLSISLDVNNIGNFDGMEIVQVYIRDIRSSLIRPEKELKFFTKVFIGKGETKTIAFTLDQEAFWFYNPAVKKWVAEPGEFEILIGASSQDIRLSAITSLNSKPMRHDTRLHTGLPLRQILNDPTGYAVFGKHFDEWIKAPELQGILDLSIEEIAAKAPNIVTPEKLFYLSEDLAKY
ncbi:MAG: glycoside hydrolase family 3 C-terminal domain-containing protein, partial [Chloroflexota bacterium]